MTYRFAKSIVLLFLTIFCISCGKDEVQAPPSIVGEWKITKRTILTDSVKLNIRINDSFAYATDELYLMTNKFNKKDIFSDTTMVESIMAKLKDPTIIFPPTPIVVYGFKNDSLHIDGVANAYSLSNKILHTTRRIGYEELKQILIREAVMGVDLLPAETSGILKTEQIRIK